MLIYRVERKFITRRLDIIWRSWDQGTKEPLVSWNKEPRSPYGWVGCDNSEETIEWMDSHGIDQGNFRHLLGSKGSINRPPPGADKKLSDAMLTHFNVKTHVELVKGWQKEFYFAFESQEHFIKWFDEEDIETLRNKGYYIAIYEVCENSVLKGDSQVMYKRADAVQVDFILI